MQYVMMIAGEGQRANYEALEEHFRLVRSDFELCTFMPLNFQETVDRAVLLKPDAVLIAYDCGGGGLSIAIHKQGFLGVSVFQRNFSDPEQVLKALQKGFENRPWNWTRTWQHPNVADAYHDRAVARKDVW